MRPLCFTLIFSSYHFHSSSLPIITASSFSIHNNNVRTTDPTNPPWTLYLQYTPERQEIFICAGGELLYVICSSLPISHYPILPYFPHSQNITSPYANFLCKKSLFNSHRHTLPPCFRMFLLSNVITLLTQNKCEREQRERERVGSDNLWRNNSSRRRAKLEKVLP